LQNQTLSDRAVTQHPKGTKVHKNSSLLLHIVQLSASVVEVDTKVTNASLTQN